ncbi:MAG TPA: PAS domain S-box protein, partial [Gemmatimonadales bacterium]|nr:PAS domain S-box protein [Gemmatimonadales bacterium]
VFRGHIGSVVDISARPETPDPLRELGRRPAVERTADGTPSAAVGTHPDISGRKELEAALRRSEERHRAVVSSLRTVVFQADAEACWLSLNPAWEEITEFPVGETLGTACLQYIHPEDRARARELFQSLGRREEDWWRQEIRCLSRSGGSRWIEVFARPTVGEGGEIIGTSGTLTDVTERRRLEDALRASEAELRGRLRELEGLYQSSPIGLALMDPANRFLRVNSRLAAINGLPVAEHLGRTLREVVPQIAHVVEPIYERVLATGEPVLNVELRGATPAEPDVERDWVAHYTPVKSDTGDITGISVAVEEVTERKRAERAQHESHRRYLDLVHTVDGIVWEVELPSLRFTFVSSQAERLLGHPIARWYDDPAFWSDHIHPEDREEAVRFCLTETERGLGHNFEYRFATADGRYLWLRDIVSVVVEDGRPVRLRGIMVDVTAAKAAEQERRLLEAQLHQAQRMEAIGRLAGGVAHDFNNLLTAIFGGLELALEAVPENSPARGDLADVRQAATRAAALTRQLLAFGRRQVLQPRALSLNAVIADAETLWRRLVGERIVIETVLDPRLGAVRVDVGQIEQVLLNLVVNARDAMPAGGTITVETREVEVDARLAAQCAGITPGRYVAVTVRDTGQGMDAATRVRIFEPFFTTKGVGQGTGLGLAVVHGIVTQSGGAVRVDSAPGQGAAFAVLLPRVEGEGAAADEPAAESVPRGRETILLVEDEDTVRNATRRILERHGYRVLEARDGADALVVWRESGPHIDLVITDVQMPELGGGELAAVLRRDRPELPVVFTSGYASDEVAALELRDGRTTFLPKPFEFGGLVRAVQSVLAG